MSFNLFKIKSEGLPKLDSATIFPFGCFFLQLIFLQDHFQLNNFHH